MLIFLFNEVLECRSTLTACIGGLQPCQAGNLNSWPEIVVSRRFSTLFFVLWVCSVCSYHALPSFWMNYQRVIPCFVLAIRVQSWSCSGERTKAWVCGQCQWSIFCTSCTKTPSSNVLGNWGDESRGKGDGILLLWLNTTYVVLIPCSFIVSLPSFLTF